MAYLGLRAIRLGARGRERRRINKVRAVTRQYLMEVIYYLDGKELFREKKTFDQIEGLGTLAINGALAQLMTQGYTAIGKPKIEIFRTNLARKLTLTVTRDGQTAQLSMVTRPITRQP